MSAISAALETPRRLATGHRLLWLIWALIMLMLAGTGVAAVRYLRQGTLADTRGDMANLGVVLAEQTSRTIQSVDVVLRDIQSRATDLGLRTPDEFRYQMAGDGVHRRLVGYLRNLPQADAIALIDDNGEFVNWSHDASVPGMDLSDRDYFRYLRDHDEAAAFISGPHEGRATGKWIMLIVRRIDGPGGVFLGVVAGVIDVKYLEDFYQKISTLPGQSVTLLHRNGEVIAGYPDIGDWRGKLIPAGSPWYERVAHGGGAYDAPDYLGELATIVTVHPLRDYPLVVDVNMTRQAALASSEQDILEVLLARTGIALVFTALFWLIARLFRRQQSHVRELARVADKLRASERQVRDYAEISSDWFWEQDAELRFRWLSKTAVMNVDDTGSYIGVTRWDLAGADVTQEPWPAHVADLEARRPFRDLRYQLRSPNGTVHFVSASGVPVFDDTGAFLGYRGTARDVTAEVQAAEELRRSKEAAEAASRAKSEFLANMSHELRTPLNAIIGFSELMQKRRSGRHGGGDEYLEWAADITASGRHLLEVINEVLELARIDAGRYVLAQDRVDLATAVRACLAMVKLQAEAKQVTIECSIADREVILRADGRAVRQIVLNLLTNAVKFTPEGGVVTLRGGRAENGDVILVVADTGIGIDAVALASLGQPFTQADASISRNYGGTGLGLSISRKLVALHGGELTIESVPGEGTTVRVIFPAIRVLVGAWAMTLQPLETTPTA
jgi:two-component system cell cycle sensor histidine kinase PleC